MIDEVGKMEMFSHQFERSLQNIMAKIFDKRFLLIATVPSKNLSLSDKLKSHPCSKLFTVRFRKLNQVKFSKFLNVIIILGNLQQ